MIRTGRSPRVFVVMVRHRVPLESTRANSLASMTSTVKVSSMPEPPMHNLGVQLAALPNLVLFVVVISSWTLPELHLGSLAYVQAANDPLVFLLSAKTKGGKRAVFCLVLLSASFPASLASCVSSHSHGST